jgi:hypothetical protein
MAGFTPKASRRRFSPFGATASLVIGAVIGFAVMYGPGPALAAMRTTVTSVTSTPAATSDAALPVDPADENVETTTTTVPPSPTTAPPVTTPPTTAAPAPSSPSTKAAPKATPTTAPAPSAASRQAAALAEPGSDHYAFLTTDQGKPVRYDPCKPIHYTANIALAPANGLADLHEAVRRVADATGLTFVYDGLSDEVPTSKRELHGDNTLDTGWPPVIVAWTRPGDTDLFSPGSVGEGGSTWSGYPGREVYVTGLVVIDATQNGRLQPGFGPSSLGAVLMHEFGHVVGLDHVADQSQLMYATVTNKPAVFGAGDRAGLRIVGAEAGCFPSR